MLQVLLGLMMLLFILPQFDTICYAAQVSRAGLALFMGYVFFLSVNAVCKVCAVENEWTKTLNGFCFVVMLVMTAFAAFENLMTSALFLLPLMILLWNHFNYNQIEEKAD